MESSERSPYKDSIRIRRQLGDRWGIAPLLQDLAYVESGAGSPQHDEQLAIECVALNRELRNRRSLAVALNTLGNVRRHLGRLAEAASVHDEAREIASSLCDAPLLALTELPLGEIALERGDIERAAHLAAQALRRLAPLDSERGIEWCLDLHARIAERGGDAVIATELMAACYTTRARLELVAVRDAVVARRGAIA